MPYYSFRCLECGLEFERRLSFHDSLDDVECPRGHTQVERIFRPPAIIFKGSGFYVTDNRASNSASKSNGKRTEKQSATAEKSATKD